MTHTADVIVVGAGPCGLTAAGDLARCGRSVVVLERWPTVNPASRAFVTMARTLEVLDARGLADDLLASTHRTPGVTIFGGARIDLTHLKSRYPFAMITPQANIDAALQNYAVSHGAEIRRGFDVIGLDQDGDGVTVTARSRADHSVQSWRARFVVGADGAHSTVRRLMGADFPGKTILSSIVLADVRLRHGPSGDGLTLRSTRQVFAFLAPYGNGWYRTMLWDRAFQVADDVPVDDGEIVDILRRATGADPGVVEVSWKSRFHCDERQVPRYRHGRVFLAGDAAHVHSPMGGQGMNTGIQDAANLSWKIDAVLGGAAETVLDSYHAERHPIGKRVLRQSGLMARGVTLRPRPARVLRNLVAPRLLRIPAVRDMVAGSFSGIGLRYGRVGARAVQIPLVSGTVTELQRTPGFVLVREHGAATVDVPGLLQAERRDDGPAVLIRPDGYAAWSGSSHDHQGWGARLADWTGAVRSAA
ncbi:FAD-dependent monooxygenase [Mycobacterium sp. MBM]|nr:FAD-dependent monooxygenase [Mycobacterium sp. MBM]